MLRNGLYTANLQLRGTTYEVEIFTVVSEREGEKHLHNFRTFLESFKPSQDVSGLIEADGVIFRFRTLASA